MSQSKEMDTTNELIKIVSKGSATISDRKIKVVAENWIAKHNDLANILSAHPKAVAAYGYLVKSVGNQRLSRKRWLKNLGAVRKALLSNSRSNTKNSFIFDPSKPFTAYQVLKDLFSKTKKETLIFDGYVEEGTLDILSVVPQKAKIKLLTNNTYGKFLKELPKFKKEFPNSEARQSSVVHDRFFTIDDQYYVSGTSLHSFGGKKTSYIFKMDAGVGKILRNYFDSIWTTASKL